jgi:hypothetical protein
MYRSAAVAIISIWSLCANAADWQVVADTKLGVLKLDAASVNREGRYTAAALVYEFKEQQMLHVPSKPLFNKRQDEVLADCSKPSLGIRTSRFFDDGKLTHTITRKDDETRFSTPAPDTMALTVFESVCAAAKTKP